MLYLPATCKLGDSSEQMKKSLRKKNLPILYRDNAEVLCLVCSTQKSPRGFGKPWLLPICSVFSSDGVGGPSPICLLRSSPTGPLVAMVLPTGSGRNKIPLTPDTGPPQAANLFSFRGPCPCLLSNARDSFCAPSKSNAQTTIRFLFKNK